MEAGNAAKKAFARCDRRESDTLYPRSAFFDAVSAGNVSASAFRLMLARFHLDLHLPSALNFPDLP